jgi:hypothetical protein
VHFLETGFTSEMDFIVAWYSATNSSLLSNSQFHFQGILVGTCLHQFFHWNQLEPVFSLVGG